MIGRKTIVAVGLILILVIVLMIPLGQSDTPDASFGKWKVGIRAIASDGTTIPLSVVNTVWGQLLSVSSGGVEFESIEFLHKMELIYRSIVLFYKKMGEQDVEAF